MVFYVNIHIYKFFFQESFVSTKLQGFMFSAWDVNCHFSDHKKELHFLAHKFISRRPNFTLVIFSKLSDFLLVCMYNSPIQDNKNENNIFYIVINPLASNSLWGKFQITSKYFSMLEQKLIKETWFKDSKNSSSVITR